MSRSLSSITICLIKPRRLPPDPGTPMTRDGQNNLDNNSQVGLCTYLKISGSWHSCVKPVFAIRVDARYNPAVIVTESFVMLNLPKTGSTFARKVIKDLYASAPRSWFKRTYCLDLILPNIRHAGEPDQHGCYCQIPRQYRKREIVSILRSPYERFLSAFEFRHWAYHPPRPAEVIRECFPTFPNLKLDEYIDFQYCPVKSRIGVTG